MCSSSFLSPSTGAGLDLYNKADDSTYAYTSSDDGLFSEGTTILDEVDELDDIVEAANMDSFF